MTAPCDAPPAVEVNIAPSASSPSGWGFTPVAGNQSLVGPYGDFDFHAQSGPVVVTLHLVNPTPSSVIFDQDKKNKIDVFGFLPQDYGPTYSWADITPVADPSQDHHFGRIDALTDGGRTVTFCYLNHHDANISRYVIYLAAGNKPIQPIDPRITNGQFSGGP